MQINYYFICRRPKPMWMGAGHTFDVHMVGLRVAIGALTGNDG